MLVRRLATAKVEECKAHRLPREAINSRKCFPFAFPIEGKVESFHQPFSPNGAQCKEGEALAMALKGNFHRRTSRVLVNNLRRCEF